MDMWEYVDKCFSPKDRAHDTSEKAKTNLLTTAIQCIEVAFVVARWCTALRCFLCWLNGIIRTHHIPETRIFRAPVFAEDVHKRVVTTNKY